MTGKMKITAVVFLTLAVLAAARVSSGRRKDAEVSKTFFAMDTVMTLTAAGPQAEEAVEAAVEEIQRLDDMLSTGKEDSLVCQLNEKGSGAASGEIRKLLQYSQELYASTDGCFDITIYPVMKLWGFPTGEYHVPGTAELEAAGELLGMDQILLEEESSEIVLQKKGMAIDFGGIAKGYTSDRVMDIFREYGVKRGIVSLGGNVQTLGTKEDGTCWRIAIRDPENPDSYLGVVEASDAAVITSGGYERYFEENGKSYHHIIDPATCIPADSGLISVTIVSGDGTLADGLSTSLYIMGLQRAKEYWQEHSGEFEAVLVSQDGKIAVTEGLEGRFTSEKEYEIINQEH